MTFRNALKTGSTEQQPPQLTFSVITRINDIAKMAHDNPRRSFERFKTVTQPGENETKP